MTTRPRLLLTVAAAILIAACGGGSPSSDAARTATPSPGSPAATPSSGTVPTPPPQTAGQQPVAPVDFEQLVGLIPDRPGWTRSKPRGDRVMGMSISRAQASYEQGDTEIDLELTDTAFNQMYLAGLSMFLLDNFSERTADGYKKGLKLAGYPGFESWENGPKRAEVTVVVGGRFVVIGRGTNVENVNDVKALVRLVDFARLATLR